MKKLYVNTVLTDNNKKYYEVVKTDDTLAAVEELEDSLWYLAVDQARELVNSEDPYLELDTVGQFNTLPIIIDEVNGNYVFKKPINWNLVLVNGDYIEMTDSNWLKFIRIPMTDAPVSDYELVEM